MIAARLSLTIRVVCAVAGSLVFAPSAALAARGHVFERSFGSKGAGPGQLNEPSGVAVSAATGDVYVVDKGNNRVGYFSAAGAYIGQFNGSGSNVAVEGKAAPAGQFSSPEGIAIDNDPSSPSFGDVYVADVGHEVIDKFSSTGKFVAQLTETSPGSRFGRLQGIAVDASGLLWVSHEGVIDSFSAAEANEYLPPSRKDPRAGELEQLAVDSHDNLYVKTVYQGVSKLNSSGEIVIQRFDTTSEKPYLSEIGGLAVDLSSNEVYIDGDDARSVGRFSSTGLLVERFGSEHLSHASGIAVDSGTGEVYVADEAEGKVDSFVLEPEGRPKIESEGPSLVTGSSATLDAQIKPAGPDTTYYFQYGLASCSASPASCTDLPAPPGVDIGEGFETESVNVHLQGLQPSTTYHFRVIAINKDGETAGAEQSFTTQAVGGEFALPNGRMWEMVTPPNKYGSDLFAVGNEQGADIQAAEGGSLITYAASSPFAASPAGSRSPEVTQVFSTRSAPGRWATADITTPHTEGATEQATGHQAEYKLFSSDLSLGLVEPEGHTPLSPKLTAEETQEKTIYIRLENGEYKALVTQANVWPGTKFGGNGEGAGGVGFVAATPDLSHVVIASNVRLTATPVEEGGAGYLYEWAAGPLQRQLQLASVLPNNEPVQASLGYRGQITAGSVRNAISSDGSHLVFEANGHHDYLRDMSTGKTVAVDAAQGTPEPGGAESHYQTANREDSRVFFTSPERLTANSTTSPVYPPTEDLYEFEVTSAPGESPTGKLTDLSVDANSGESADVRGVIGASEDGSYVYFVANGVIGNGAEHGAKTGKCEHTSQPSQQTCNFYAEHYDGTAKAWTPPTFIATLSGADSPSWGEHAEDLKLMTSRVSPNGRYLAFMSERSLTGYENRDASSGVPDEEVYLYEAGANRLVCASCNPTGARPKGLLEGNAYEERLVDYAQIWPGRWLAANVPGWTTKDGGSALYQSRYLSNSGRLFFDSADALVPADGNGKEDVYQYEPAGVGGCVGPGYGKSSSVVFDESAGGCVGLISAGTSTEESAFMDASESGGDVFFMTTSRLSPQDLDTSLDIYDAHECVSSSPCAPAAALAPPPCNTGDACKPAPTPQPAIFGAPSSATFSGAGNVVSPVSAKTKVKSLTRAHKLAEALRACHKKRKKTARADCEKHAKKRYKPAKAKKSRAKKAAERRRS
ncbi:MAG: PD40 domain-containing protein [Solirubrobacterales bacterium]|nr:PD40 domain-containing protein [Solirubrobacterales bacterium]